MARIPKFETPTQINAVNQPQLQQAPEGAFGGQVGRAMMQAADVVQQAQDEADNLRVQDAYNQLRERQLDLTLNPNQGYVNVKGKDVMTPRDGGKSMSDDYLEKFNQVGSELEGTLANDRQKLKFKQKFADSHASFRQGLQQHEIKEAQAYAKTVTNSTIVLETEAAAKQWNDPQAVSKSIANITESLTAQRTREGMPAAEYEAILQDKVSGVHAKVLAMALENRNVAYAEQYVKQYGKDMQAADLLKYKGAIDKELMANEAVATATEVFRGAQAKMQPNDVDRLINLTAGAESGNRERDANGNLITSKKGAKGKMQVMDDTNRDPGFGVKPAADGSDAERTRVGQDYLKAMLKRYGGDIPKALAAYNAGPGVLDAALEENADGNWLKLMPKETRDYVAKITAQYANGAGKASVPTLEDLHEQVRTRMAGRPAAAVKLAIDEMSKRYEDSRKAIKQREDDAVSEAFKQLDANGGNYAALPATLTMAIPGDKIDTLQSYARQRAKGVEPTTDWNQYYALRSDPKLLKDTNLAALKHQFADAEFKQLVQEQESLRKDPGGHTTATRNATQILNAYMLELGVDTTPKPSTSPTSDAAKMGRAMRLQQDAITNEEKAKGRKLTPDEVEKVTAGLFTKFEVKGTIFGTDKKPRFDLKPTDKIVIPAAERAQITEALKASGRPVNDMAIMTLYRAKNNLPLEGQ